MAMKRYTSVENYLRDVSLFQDELVELRRIVVSEKRLDETLKWSLPCYTYKRKNVLGIAGFKSYFGMWFFQGALLDDPKNVLINAQEGKTEAMRQWRMNSSKDIKPRIIKNYISRAIELVDSGLEIKPKKKRPPSLAPELAAALAADPKAEIKFFEMTPGKQRDYCEYISTAKRDETKQKRIAKIVPMIREGVGLNDKYRNC